MSPVSLTGARRLNVAADCYRGVLRGVSSRPRLPGSHWGTHAKPLYFQYVPHVRAQSAPGASDRSDARLRCHTRGLGTIDACCRGRNSRRSLSPVSVRASRSRWTIKRTTATAVDTIVAEDIGEFPDLNLAESLQRIPGVSIARDAGEGRQITVRGLGPQFTRVRINGMEALSTAGGTDGRRHQPQPRLRLQRVRVRAVQLALGAQDRVGRGRGRLARRHRGPARRRPFDYDGFTFVTSVQGGYNDLAKSSIRAPRCWSATSLPTVARRAGVGGLHRAQAERRRPSTVRWQKGGFTTLAPGYTGPTLPQINAASIRASRATTCT